MGCFIRKVEMYALDGWGSELQAFAEIDLIYWGIPDFLFKVTCYVRVSLDKLLDK